MQTPQTTARRYFVRLIWTALALSVVGNALHALPGAAGQVGVQIALAVLPPLLLAALVHGMSHLAAARVSGRLYRAGAAAVVLLATGAGAVSFVSLRELAVVAGWSPALGWLLPVIIDLPVVVATAVVFAVDHAEMRECAEEGAAHEAVTTAPPAPVSDQPPAPVNPAHESAPPAPTPSEPGPPAHDVPDLTSTDDAPADDAGAPVRRSVIADVSIPTSPQVKPAPGRRTVPAAQVLLDDGDLRRTAECLVEEGRTNADVDTVCEVLVRLARGESGRAVAGATGVGEASVRRIKKAAQELATTDDRELVNS